MENKLCVKKYFHKVAHLYVIFMVTNPFSKFDTFNPGGLRLW